MTLIFKILIAWPMVSVITACLWALSFGEHADLDEEAEALAGRSD